MGKRKPPVSNKRVCATPNCKNPLHIKDRHDFCLVCLSPRHFSHTCTHKHSLCKICRHMAGSSYRDCKSCRSRLLKSNTPGRQSLAQPLVSVVTGGQEPSESGKSEFGSVPQSSSGSSSKVPPPGYLRSSSTHTLMRE